MGHLQETHGKQFYNKDDSLTVYYFACGYIEKFTVTSEDGKKSAYVTLEKDSACWHVKALISDSRTWESFDTLTEARKFYKAQKRIINSLTQVNI